MITESEKAAMSVEWLLWQREDCSSERYSIRRMDQPDGSFKFAILQGTGSVLGKKDLEVHHQCLPSSRDDEFYEEFRYDTWEEAYDRWIVFHTAFPKGTMMNIEYNRYLIEQQRNSSEKISE